MVDNLVPGAVPQAGLMKMLNCGQVGAARSLKICCAPECGDIGKKAPTGARYDSLGCNEVAAKAADRAEPQEHTHQGTVGLKEAADILAMTALRAALQTAWGYQS